MDSHDAKQLYKSLSFYLDAHNGKEKRHLEEKIKLMGGQIACHRSNAHFLVVPDDRIVKGSCRIVKVSDVENWMVGENASDGSKPLVVRAFERLPLQSRENVHIPRLGDGRVQRNAFTVAEDLAIASYVEEMKNRCIPNQSQSGSVPMSVWRAMSDDGITQHSAESMKRHFAKLAGAPLHVKLVHEQPDLRSILARRKRKYDGEETDAVSASGESCSQLVVRSPGYSPGCYDENSDPATKLRRITKRWSDEETRVLIAAYGRLGSQWKEIWARYFRNGTRTQVDLKDKYRNLVKFGQATW